MAGSKRKARPALAVHQTPVAEDTGRPDTEHPGRIGRSMIGVYVPRLAHVQFKRLCLDLDTTQQQLVTDMLNELFKKHGLPPIA
jgi:hypothetical protein